MAWPSPLTADEVTTAPATIQITGVLPVAVTGNGLPIVKGVPTASLSTGTDLGTTLVGQTLTQSFSITNSGQQPLHLDPLSLSDPADFAILTPPLSSVAPGASVAFTVQFDPQAPGWVSGTVQFSDDGPDGAAPFTFAVGGSGEFTPTATVVFQATDASGNPLTSVRVGTAFQLRALVQDTSYRGSYDESGNDAGVDSAYIDGTYDSSLVSIPSDATANIATFAPPYVEADTENTQTAGSFVQTGGTFATGLYPTEHGPGLFPLFSLPVTATAVGTETFTPSFDTSRGNNNLYVFGGVSDLTCQQCHPGAGHRANYCNPARDVCVRRQPSYCRRRYEHSSGRWHGFRRMACGWKSPDRNLHNHEQWPERAVARPAGNLGGKCLRLHDRQSAAEQSGRRRERNVYHRIRGWRCGAPDCFGQYPDKRHERAEPGSRLRLVARAPSLN